MKRRIYGLENEYGIIYSSQGARTSSTEKAVRYLFEELATVEGHLNAFLENGARFYLDTGSHPEYATPECASPHDVVAYDKAGERILEGLLSCTEVKLREEGLVGNLYIYKNNTDSVGNSYGCHENYLVSRSVDFYQLAEQLIPFLVTRQIFCGAGRYVRDKNGIAFHLSQRAPYIRQELSGTTTNERGIINLRDEPHADKERYRRLHITFADSNMSEYTTLLKMSTTAMVLEMIEANFITKDFSLKEPIRALQEISQYPDLSVPLTLSDGRTMTALQIQREYLHLAQTYFAVHEADEETHDILSKWEHVLECLETDPMLLRREIDWVIKRYWFGQYMQRRGIEAATDKILMLDLQYHDIHVKRGLYYLLARQGNIARIVTDEEVLKATSCPPPNTRAKLRGELIKLAKEQKIHYDLDWNYIRFGHLMNFWVRFNDPFQTESEKVLLLKQRLQRSQFSPGVILWELSGNKD